MFEQQAEEEKGQIAHLQVRQPVSTLCRCGFPLDANDTGDEIFMFCAGSPIPRHKVTFRKGPLVRCYASLSLSYEKYAR